MNNKTAASTLQRISIRDDQFMKGNSPFTIWGFNYWPSNSPGSDPIGGDWSVFCNYDSAVIEREVAAMAAIGTNTLRVWFAYAQEHWSKEHGLSKKTRNNFAHFMQTCAAHDIYVILVVGGGGSMWGVQHGLGNTFTEEPARIYTERETEQLFLKDIMTLIETTGVADCSNLLAVDLANEPIFGIPSGKTEGMTAVWKSTRFNFNQSLRQPYVIEAWKKWASQNSSLSEDAPIPTDRDFLQPGPDEHLAAAYQQFVHDCFNKHTRKFSDALRQRWPQLLVTLGFGCGGTGANFEAGSANEAIQILMLTQNVREMQEGLDFISIHLYDGTDESRLVFLKHFLGSDKPVVIEEFGHIPQNVNVETGIESEQDKIEQQTLWNTILGNVRPLNYGGALGCNFCDTGNPDPSRNIWSRMGIVDRQGNPKSSFETFEKFAKNMQPSADFHPEAIDYSPNDFRHDVEAIGTLYKEFFK